MAKKATGLNKKYTLSDELAEFMNKSTASRSEVVKAIWAYIKKEDLQHPEKKRIICPDDVLGEIIGSKSIDMFKMQSVLSKHFLD